MRTFPSFVGLRFSLLAALGAGVLHCGSDVTPETTTGTGGSTASGTTSGQGGSGQTTGGQTSGQTATASSSVGNGGGGASASVSTAESSTAQGTTGPGGAPPTSCEDPVAIVTSDGFDTGFERCADGAIRRVTPVTCDTAIDMPACGGDETFFNCMTDDNCTDGPHGKCVHYEQSFDMPGPYCGCVYSCATDEECGPGRACICNGVDNLGVNFSQCAGVADCLTGDDCPSGECGLSAFFNGCFYDIALGCRQEGDACRVDSNCNPTTFEECVYFPTGEWACEGPSCAIGRPLLVDGRARTAAARQRTDWLRSDLAPEVDSLHPALRADLADHWEKVAALEHASIASFARFSLELLAIGAPPEFLIETQSALTDEIEHARIAYALASAYAGKHLGPAALDVTALPIHTDRDAILQSLIDEACIGETLGVAEALAIATDVTDPAVRGVLLRVAEEEQRHAELAWRVLRWLLEGADRQTLASAARAIEASIERASRDPMVAARTSSPEHGLLSARELGALRRRAIAEVVRPCARALFDRLGVAGALDRDSAAASMS